MISIPIAVYNSLFEWQIDLFWHCHKKVYGNDAYNRTVAAIIDRDDDRQVSHNLMLCQTDIPYKFCRPYFDYYKIPTDFWLRPLNIQAGLDQLLRNFGNDQIIELLDCDMCHLRAPDNIDVADRVLIVDTVYEQWHLRALSENSFIIKNLWPPSSKKYYNGGFVPIIGRCSTFRIIMNDWADFHQKIAPMVPTGDTRVWWAGMYSLQAACEKNQVRMVSKNMCYVPKANKLSSEHHIVHYSIDTDFNKKTFPAINIKNFPNDKFYNEVKDWLKNWNSTNPRQKVIL